MIPRPGVDGSCKRVDLRPPSLVLLAPRPDDEDVDVAFRVSVAARRRSEDRRMDRLDLPTCELLLDPLQQDRPQASKSDDRVRGDVVAIQRVEHGSATRRLLDDDALVHESAQRLPGAILGYASETTDL